MPRVTHSDALMPDNPRARMAESARRNTVKAAQRANRRRAMPRWALPALRVGLRAAPALVLAAVGAWGWTSGRLPAAWETTSEAFLTHSAASGLAVQEVLVTGRKESDRAAVLAALGVERGTPILSFDPQAARAALESIPWVAAATVERRLPDTIFVKIVERTPMAIWQHGQKLHLVDADGVVLSDRDLARWGDLPMLVGADAPKRGKELLHLLQSEPSIGQRVQAAVLVGGRRWDLRLDNGIDVRLPEHGLGDALRQLATVQQTNKLLERDVVAIDLRVPDRLSVQTSAAAAEARRKPADAKKQI